MIAELWTEDGRHILQPRRRSARWPPNPKSHLIGKAGLVGNHRAGPGLALAAIDEAEMREIVLEAWRMVVSKRVFSDYTGSPRA